jgi:hypothetical protein
MGVVVLPAREVDEHDVTVLTVAVKDNLPAVRRNIEFPDPRRARRGQLACLHEPAVDQALEKSRCS